MSRGNPYDYCPECNSQNTERGGITSADNHKIVLVIICHHCKSKFHKINDQWVKEEV